jgi:hypothetical protein
MVCRCADSDDCCKYTPQGRPAIIWVDQRLPTETFEVGGALNGNIPCATPASHEVPGQHAKWDAATSCSIPCADRRSNVSLDATSCGWDDAATRGPTGY